MIGYILWSHSVTYIEHALQCTFQQMIITHVFDITKEFKKTKQIPKYRTNPPWNIPGAMVRTKLARPHSEVPTIPLPAVESRR